MKAYDAELRAMATRIDSPTHTVLQALVLKPDVEHEFHLRRGRRVWKAAVQLAGELSSPSTRAIGLLEFFLGGLEFNQWVLLGTPCRLATIWCGAGPPTVTKRAVSGGGKATDSTWLMPIMWSSKQ